MFLESELKEKLLNINLCEDNEYLDKYVNLICNNSLEKSEKFKTDVHHIIPRFYFKYNNLDCDNTYNNICILTIGNHILAHYYLSLCSYNKLYAQLNALSVRYSFNRKFDTGLTEKWLIDNLPEIEKINQLIREKTSEWSKQHNNGENNGFYGKHHSESYKEKLRAKRNSWSEEQKQENSKKLSEAAKGKKHSQETIEKIR